MPPDAIHRLDQLVWNVRRYCRHIPDRGVVCNDAVPDMQKAIVRAINDPSNKRSPHSYPWIGGELESIVMREPKDPARKALLWANLFYGKKRRLRATYDGFSSSEIPPNEREWADVDWKAVEFFVKP